MKVNTKYIDTSTFNFTQTTGINPQWRGCPEDATLNPSPVEFLKWTFLASICGIVQYHFRDIKMRTSRLSANDIEPDQTAWIMLGKTNHSYFQQDKGLKYFSPISPLIYVLMLKPKVINICHPYTARPVWHICAVRPGSILLADQL